MSPDPGPVYCFEDVTADAARLEVRRGSDVLELEPKAIRVLLYLIRHRERVVSKEELIAEVWAGAFVSDNSLTRVIAQIRKRLGDSARSPRYIETSATTGYRFIAELREGAPAPTAAAVKMPRRIAIAGALAIAAAAIALYLVPGPVKTVKLAGLRQITTSRAADLWPTFSPDTSQIAFSSNRSGRFEIYVRSLAPGSTERQVTNDVQENIQPAWSPDGRYLAYVPRQRGGIAVVPVSGGATRYLTDHGDTPAWSPDGKFVAFRASSLKINPALETTGLPDTTIWMVNVDGTGAHALTKLGSPPGGHNFPRWASDGRHVMFSASTTPFLGTAKSQIISGRLWMVDTGTGALQEIEINAATVRSPVLSGDGRDLYYVGAGALGPGLWHAAMRGARGHFPEILVTAGGSTPRDPAISPDGKHLAFSQQTGESAIWSVSLAPDGTAAGEPAPLIQERSFRNAEPTFSADGSKLAYSSIRQGDEWGVFVANADGTNPQPVTDPEQVAGRPSWRGSGDVLGYRALRKGQWSYWLLPLGGSAERLDLKLDLQRSDRMHFSPDGTQMLAHISTPAGFQIVVEDLVTHSIRKVTPADKSYGFPYWSRDGKWIITQQRVGGENKLVYLPAGGGDIRSLETGMVQAMAHDSSPDSDKISFAGLVGGVWNIYWISRSSGHVQQLTHFTSHAAFVRYPAPKNDQIVFENNNVSANIYMADLH